MQNSDPASSTSSESDTAAGIRKIHNVFTRIFKIIKATVQACVGGPTNLGGPTGKKGGCGSRAGLGERKISSVSFNYLKEKFRFFDKQGNRKSLLGGRFIQ